jgi:hypothetical protein
LYLGRREADRSLVELCRDWKAWAVHAEKVEDGWQTDYPGWADLLATAREVMAQASLSEKELQALDLCWAISEETEPLLEYAQSHLAQCWLALSELARVGQPDTRWQVYSALGAAQERPGAESLLREGLDDPDPYCRRRTLISLARFKPVDARQLAERFLGDSDPYLRQAAIEMVRVSSDAEFMRRKRQQLLKDATWHVRQAAETLMVNGE